MKSITPLIKILAIVLILLNVAAVAGLSIELSRWVRVITAGVFIWAYFLHFSKKTLLLLSSLISFLLADIFALTYELDFSKNAFFTLHGVSFLLLFLHISKGTKRALMSRFQKLFIPGAFLLSLTILLALGLTFQKEIDGYWHLIFFYFHGLSAIACLITALAFYDSKMNYFAMFYLIAALSLIFSDLTAFPAVYLEAKGFFYFSRIFYVIGLGSLVQFSFLSKQSRSSKAEDLTAPEVKIPETEKSYHDH